MSVETNNPAVVIYTANYLQDIGFKNILLFVLKHKKYQIYIEIKI